MSALLFGRSYFRFIECTHKQVGHHDNELKKTLVGIF